MTNLVHSGLTASIPSEQAPAQRVIVCGGRDYADYGAVCDLLDSIHVSGFGIHVIIHGNARGADTLAGRWASENRVNCLPVPANWSRDGKRAGPLRNQQMLEMAPDLVVAFAGGLGTADMVRRAERAGVRVIKSGAPA